jgi:S-methylmethionine-dependent homocysteine/selenocysteine methylase
MHGVTWCADALDSHPDLVRAVHEDYIRAGAEIITTNTYPTARHVLEPAGLGGAVKTLNERAVALAKRAREAVSTDHPVYIAGSMSTFGASNDRSQLPPPERERANYREQAEILAAAGVDLLLAENLYSIEQGGYLVEAAVQTGLPTWIGFSCRVGRDGTLVITNEEREEPFDAALRSILPLGGDLMCIMHTEVADVAPALEILRGRWSGPMGAYAHSGHFRMPDWSFDDVISPDAYLAEAQRWIGTGVQVVGGCCGIGPDHIRRLRQALSR